MLSMNGMAMVRTYTASGLKGSFSPANLLRSRQLCNGLGQLRTSSLLCRSTITSAACNARQASLLSPAPKTMQKTRMMSLIEHRPLLSLSRYGTMHSKQEHNPSGEYSTKAEVKKEVGFIKQTFGFIGAPKDAVYLGLAGVLPYLATAAVTATMSYQTRLAIEQGHTTMFTPEIVHHILDVLEPIQIGYGAVILSFLGAIHWGFEWSKLGGRAGMVRYLPGVLAPAVAWPTLYLPFESALLTQFGAFTIMYFFDSSASARGTAPGWYGNYRWVLTFIIGLSVFVTIWSREMLVLHGYRSSSEIKGEEMKETAREVISGDGGVKAAIKAVSDKSPAAAHYKESNADRMRHSQGQNKA